MTAANRAPVTSARGIEADLVKAAVAGSGDAFAELYRRHAQTGWRLAQALVEAGAAPDCLAEGFVRALHGLRHHWTPASQPFRPMLLGGVYLAATERTTPTDRPAARPPTADAGRSLTGAAFWCLPVRWRCALWLAEVEGMGAGRIAQVLGVSAAVAAQLVARGYRAFHERLRQAGVDPPESIAPALRALGAPLPSALAADSFAAWQAALASEPIYRLTSAFAWCNSRATRPLGLVAGCVLGLGLVAVGVVGQRSELATFGPATLDRGSEPGGGIGIQHKDRFPGSPGRTAGAGNTLLTAAGGVAPLASPSSAVAAVVPRVGQLADTQTGTSRATRPAAGSGLPPRPGAGNAGPAAPVGSSPSPSTAPAGGNAPTTVTTLPPATNPSSIPPSTAPPPPTDVTSTTTGVAATTTTTTPLAPLTTLITTNGGGLQVNVGPLAVVSIGGTGTTAPQTGTTTTTTTPLVAVTVLNPQCVAKAKLLGISISLLCES